MAYCSNCGAKLDADANFCKDCGTPVPADVKNMEAQQGQGGENAAKTEVPLQPQPTTTYAVPQPPRKKFTAKMFLLIAGAVMAGIILISIVITCVSVVGHDLTGFHFNNDDSNYYYDNGYDDSSDSGDDYSEYFDDYYYGDFFMAEIPDSWEGHYDYTESDSCVTFYNTDNDDAGYGGVLFAVCRYDQGTDMEEELPDYEYLGEDDDYIYVLALPTDVEYGYEDESLTAIYQEMMDDGESILIPSINTY